MIFGLRLACVLSKLGSPGKRQLLGARVEQRRRLERFIDPSDQVAIDEQLLAQQSGEIGQTPAKASAQLQVLEHEQRDQSGPDLNLQGVGAGAHEGLDAQVLLQRFEQLNDILPINNLVLKLPSTTASILCVRTACRWSGCTNYMTKPTTSCGAPTADRWRCPSG